ncbi:MAG: branched-chain amino acid ABC transporter permease, partial [Planctomycetota bacterium]
TDALPALPRTTFLRRTFGGQKLDAYNSPLDFILGGLLLLAVIAVPIFNANGFRGTVPNLVMYVSIYMVLAVGLNIVVGYTGLLDLGYVVFLTTGAVVMSFLTSLVRTADGSIDWGTGVNRVVEGTPLFAFDGSVFILLLAAGLVCALLGVIRGIPTLRVTGDYYAIVTLGFAEIVFEVFLWDNTRPLEVTRITGGTQPTPMALANRPSLFGAKLYYDTWQFYYLVIGIVILAFIVSHHLNRSRIGRAWAAIRTDETAARAVGVSVSKYKVMAFAISGFIGGVGGALFALWTPTVAVKSFDFWQSILILCCIVLGGMGSLRGVALGTIVLMSLGEVLRQPILGIRVPAEARFLVYGILLLIFMRFRPQGFLPPIRRGKELKERERQRLATADAPLFTLHSEAEDRQRETRTSAPAVTAATAATVSPRAAAQAPDPDAESEPMQTTSMPFAEDQAPKHEQPGTRADGPSGPSGESSSEEGKSDA